MKKKAVFVFRTMGAGGAQKIEAFVANSLLEKNYEVIAINMSLETPTVNIDPRIKIIDVPYDCVVNASNIVRKTILKINYLRKLRKIIKSLKPDVLCAFLSDVVRIVILASCGCKIPVIGSERGDPYRFTTRQFKAYRRAYMKCEYVIFQLENVARKYALPKSIKQKVIPNPASPRKFAHITRNRSTSKHIIVGAGRLAKQKRFDVLIDAFEIVYRKFPDYCLHIYGDGPLKKDLEAQIQNSPAGSAISLLGNVDDVFAAACSAEFFALSSDFEGIPNVIIEAMAAGFACVATDCTPGGARYLLEDNDCGLIVPCENKEKLAEAIIVYIKNPELRINNERKGLEVVKKFDPEVIKKEWINIFEECTENARLES